MNEIVKMNKSLSIFHQEILTWGRLVRDLEALEGGDDSHQRKDYEAKPESIRQTDRQRQKDRHIFITNPWKDRQTRRFSITETQTDGQTKCYTYNGETMAFNFVDPKLIG